MAHSVFMGAIIEVVSGKAQGGNGEEHWLDWKIGQEEIAKEVNSETRIKNA